MELSDSEACGAICAVPVGGWGPYSGYSVNQTWAQNDRTVSGVTRRASARLKGGRALAGSLPIEPFERSRWRLRRTRATAMGVESSKVGRGWDEDGLGAASRSGRVTTRDELFGSCRRQSSR
jgi:hypothetical protein